MAKTTPIKDVDNGTLFKRQVNAKTTFLMLEGMEWDGGYAATGYQAVNLTTFTVAKIPLNARVIVIGKYE